MILNTAAGLTKLLAALSLGQNGRTFTPFYLTLHTAIPATAANELQGGGYARLLVARSFVQLSYQQRIRNYQVSSRRTQEAGGVFRYSWPPADTNFPVATAAWAGVRAIGMSASSVVRNAAEPIFAWTPELADAPVVLAAGERFTVPANTLYIETDGSDGVTNAGVDAILFGRVAGSNTIYPGFWDCFMGLHTGTPATAENELSGKGYARIGYAIIRSSIVDGARMVALPKPNATNFADVTSAWTTPTHFGIWDALTGGNLLATGPISPAAPASPSVGNYQLPANAVTLTLDSAA